MRMGIGWLAGLLACLWLLPSMGQDMQTGAGLDQERARIASAKQLVEHQFEIEDKDCRTRFVVTSCQEAAKLKRLRALDALKREERTLDAASRKEAAIARQARIDNHQPRSSDSAKANHAAKDVQRLQKADELSSPQKVSAIKPADDVDAKRRAYAQKQVDAAERARRRDDKLQEAKRKADERVLAKLKNAQ